MLSRKIETIKGLIVGSCWLSLVMKYFSIVGLTSGLTSGLTVSVMNLSRRVFNSLLVSSRLIVCELFMLTYTLWGLGWCFNYVSVHWRYTT